MGLTSSSAASADKMDHIQVDPPTQIAIEDVKQMLQEGKGDIQVIDCRDYDYVGGHIKGCINREVDKFDEPDSIDELLTQIGAPASGVRYLVFHCLQSRVRGPHCAMATKRRIAQVAALSRAGGDSQENEEVDEEDILQPQVLVMRGGFEGWVARMESDPELRALTEDYDEAAWRDR